MRLGHFGGRASSSFPDKEAGMSPEVLPFVGNAHLVDEMKRRLSSEVGPQVDDGQRHNRMRSANSVEVDPDRFRHFCWMKRMTLVDVSRSIGRSDAWASVCLWKRRVGFYALDELATELGVNLFDLIFAIGTDAERERSFA
jgi:hypothetical protein